MDTGALKTRGLPVRLPCRSPSCVLLAACCPRPAGPRGAGACPPGTWVSSEPLGQEAALEEREGPTPLSLTSGSLGLRLLIHRKEGVFWATRRVSRLGVKGEPVLEKVQLRAPQGCPSRGLGPGEEGQA